MDPSNAVVSRISPGLGRGFFSFSDFFFFFFLGAPVALFCSWAVFIVDKVFSVDKAFDVKMFVVVFKPFTETENICYHNRRSGIFEYLPLLLKQFVPAFRCSKFMFGSAPCASCCCDVSFFIVSAEYLRK